MAETNFKQQQQSAVFPSCWWVAVHWREPECTDVFLAKTWPMAKAARAFCRQLLVSGEVLHFSIYDGACEVVYDSDGSLHHPGTRELLCMTEPRKQGRYEWLDAGAWQSLDEAPDERLAFIVHQAGDHRANNQFLDGKRACLACGHPGWRQTTV